MNKINVDYTEASNNKYSIKCIVVTALILYLTWILNLLNIFIINSTIFLFAVIGGTIITLIALLLPLVCDLNKKYVKYIIIALTVLIYSFITSCLTYHTTLCLVFPMIYSAQYRSKRVMWYTYAMTVLGIVFSIVGGYLYGLCDANMVLFTCNSVQDFISNFTDIVIQPDNWFSIILFFAFPKILLVLGALPMLVHLNTVIEKRTQQVIDEQEKNLNLSHEIVVNQQKVIVSLASIVESRDQITGNHIKNTAKYVEFLVRKLLENNSFEGELNNEYAALVVQAAPLHDIGKIHIPDSILCKEGKLTEDEYAEMKKHPVYGFELLYNFADDEENQDYLRMAKDVCLYHHERYDGNGYPNHLKGEDIPLCGRIMAVADVLDALLSKRQYKEAYSFEKTLKILNEERGKQFDPIILDTLLNNWKEFVNEIYNCDEK